MSNEKEKTVEKLNNDESTNVSGGKNLPPKEERIYVCQPLSLKRPITLKYGVPCPDPKSPDLDVDPKPLYGVPSPYPGRKIKNNLNDQVTSDDETND